MSTRRAPYLLAFLYFTTKPVLAFFPSGTGHATFISQPELFRSFLKAVSRTEQITDYRRSDNLHEYHPRSNYAPFENTRDSASSHASTRKMKFFSTSFTRYPLPDRSIECLLSLLRAFPFPLRIRQRRNASGIGFPNVLIGVFLFSGPDFAIPSPARRGEGEEVLLQKGVIAEGSYRHRRAAVKRGWGRPAGLKRPPQPRLKSER